MSDSTGLSAIELEELEQYSREEQFRHACERLIDMLAREDEPLLLSETRRRLVEGEGVDADAFQSAMWCLVKHRELDLSDDFELTPLCGNGCLGRVSPDPRCVLEVYGRTVRVCLDCYTGNNG